MANNNLHQEHEGKTILFIAEMLGYGGMSTLISEVGHFLNQRGYSLLLLTVTTHPLNTQLKKRFSSFSKIYYKKLPAYEGVLNKTRIIYLSLRLLIKVLKQEKVDMLWGTLPLSTLGTMLHPRSWKIPKVYFFLSPLDLELQTNYFGKSARKTLLTRIKIKIYYLSTKISLDFFPVVLTLSLYAKNLLVRHYKIDEKNIRITPGFISTKHSRNVKVRNRNKIRESLGIDTNKVVFLFPSRFEPWKNPEIILKALKIMKNDQVLVIFSGGHVRQEHFQKWSRWAVANNVHKYITFYPYLSRTELIKLYRASDCVLFPSLNLEMFGYVALEALSLGIPVIGSHTGAIPEMLSRVDLNLLVRPPTAKEFAKKIKWIMRLNKNERHNLSQKCIDASKFYNSEKNKKILYKEIKNALNHQKPQVN